MTILVEQLNKNSLIHPPQWLCQNTIYECVMGSTAYGCSTDESDWDIYGIAIPPKHVLFPHLNGEIFGFSTPKERFEQFLAPGIFDGSAQGGKGRNYDITIFNIVKYFRLLMECNPNVLDSIYVPRQCILHITQVGEMIRDNRKIFLHKGLWHKFRGYSFSQLHKAKGKNPTGKRVELREKYGMDTKFLYNVVRLCLECEQLLSTGDMDLQRDNELYKAIRRGERSEEDITNWFAEKEKYLEKLYEESKLPWGPDEGKIQQLLLQVLEHHYGSLDKCVVNVDKATETISKISNLIEEYNRAVS